MRAPRAPSGGSSGSQQTQNVRKNAAAETRGSLLPPWQGGRGGGGGKSKVATVPREVLSLYILLGTQKKLL